MNDSAKALHCCWQTFAKKICGFKHASAIQHAVKRCKISPAPCLLSSVKICGFKHTKEFYMLASILLQSFATLMRQHWHPADGCECLCFS